MSEYFHATTNRLTTEAVHEGHIDFTDSVPTLEKDAVIDDRYVIQERLGMGTQATVYRASDTMLEEEVALKIMKISGDEALDRAVREAAVTEALGRSAGVVAFKGAGISSESGHDVPYIALELCEAGNLRKVWRDTPEGPMAIEGVKKALLPALRGLDTVHQAGLTHRDVKPENILLADTGEGKLSDFGIVRGEADAVEELQYYDLPLEVVAAPLTATDRGNFTMNYAPPEVLIQGALFTPEGDVYSASLVACEALTGAHPWRHIMVPGIQYADGIMRYQPEIRQPQNGNIPREVLDFLGGKGLASNPKDRATTPELIECLESL